MAVEKVILIKPRGFCAGVGRAIKIVEECLKLFGKPVYVKHQIVHNKHVVRELEKKGAVTVESIEDVPEGSVVVFSAHGSQPSDYTRAREKGLRIIDATCPLVTKVHLEVHRFAKEGYKIIYIGHKGHVEGIGVMGELPGKLFLVESAKDVGELDIGNPEKLVYLTQTTLSVDETIGIVSALRKKYPQIKDPPRVDICYATTNRQKAVKELASRADVILVVGSKNSSNSIRLVETARLMGKKAYLIDNADDLKSEWFKNARTVGITAGASAPEILVQEAADYFTARGAEKEEIAFMEENVRFTEPAELSAAKEDKGSF